MTDSYLTQTAEPGWYIDPGGTAALRYFDGYQWTHHLSPTKSTSSWYSGATIKFIIILFTIGTILTGYFLWNLYGDSVYTIFKQHQLRSQLLSTPPTNLSSLPPIGDPVGTIIIPSIGVNDVFVAGTGGAQLAMGPGLWTAGSIPGQPGNATISGHRTTHTAPFYNLGKLTIGSLIYIDIPGQTQDVFQVRAIRAVSPNDVAVTDQTPGVRLTLTTCNPLYSATTRLVVQSEEIKGANVAKALPPSQWSFVG
jgi:sortase A